MQHWIAYWLGMDDPAGPVYLFYSGFLGGVPVLAAVAVFARHRNCHVHGCWRIGRHLITGTPYVVCRHHDPDGPVTFARVRERHRLRLGKQPGHG